MITGSEHQMRIPPRTRVVLFAAGPFALLAVAVAPFVHAPAARADNYFEFCKNSLGQPDQVCCNNSGGEWDNGVCASPAALPTVLPTITQQILPPLIGAPR